MSKPNFAARAEIAKDTVNRSPAIVKSHVSQGASLDSSFISSQLPALPPLSNPPTTPTPISVLNSDAFTVARQIISSDSDARGKVAVLNLASDEQPGGGWLFSLSTTQEEALCYSSTLFATLKPSYYPWPNLGPGSTAGVYSPGVVIFKDDLDHGCVDLTEKDREVVGVITVAAPRGPVLTKDWENFRYDSDLRDLREKIRLVYRMAGSNGNEYLVLGAMGCGAYGCPPRQVAEEMKTILFEDEFKDRFKQIVFAVYSPQPGKGSNFEVFREVFEEH